MKLPKTERGIRSRIKKYEDILMYEKRKFGGFFDNGGHRYDICVLYMLVDDLNGAMRAFRLFDKRFPDDCGTPEQYLMWALALYKKGLLAEAEIKLKKILSMNPYILPRLFGDIIEFNVGESLTEKFKKAAAIFIPIELFSAWDCQSKEWAEGVIEWKKT